MDAVRHRVGTGHRALTNSIADGKLAIVSHLESLSPLSDNDRELLASATGPSVTWRAGHELIACDALLDEPVFVVSGWVGRIVNLSDGRRQVVAFYIPGDLVGFSSRPDARARASHVCLTNVVTASAREVIRHIRHEPFRYSALAVALNAVEDEINKGLIDQIVRVGRMSAHERMIHLIADLYRRHRRAGLEVANGFVFPLTQETLGNALGLSTVHVNRTMQQLRRERTIKTVSGRIEITDPALLADHSRVAGKS
jgi:CRP-like cAMP-binding protein